MSGILIRIMLFLLPFLIYGLWLAALRGRGIDARLERRITIAGAVLLTIFAIIAVFHLLREPEAGRDAGYVPPRLEDGRIQPGEFHEPDGESDKPDNDGDPQTDR